MNELFAKHKFKFERNVMRFINLKGETYYFPFNEFYDKNVLLVRFALNSVRTV